MSCLSKTLPTQNWPLIWGLWYHWKSTEKNFFLKECVWQKDSSIRRLADPGFNLCVCACSVANFATEWMVAHQVLSPWDSPDKKTEVGCYFILQGIFPRQGSNLQLLHCRQILYSWTTREAPESISYRLYDQDVIKPSLLERVVDLINQRSENLVPCWFLKVLPVLLSKLIQGSQLEKYTGVIKLTLMSWKQWIFYWFRLKCKGRGKDSLHMNITEKD